MPKPTPPDPTSPEIVREGLLRYYQTHVHWPTLDQLVADNPGWQENVTRNRLFWLRGGSTDDAPAAVIMDLDRGTYRLGEYPNDPETVTSEEESEVPKGIPIEWPDDATLIDLADEIQARGGRVTKELAHRFESTPKRATTVLREARQRIIERTVAMNATGIPVTTTTSFTSILATPLPENGPLILGETHTETRVEKEPSPIVHFISQGNAVRTLSWTEEELPSQGDEWAEPIRDRDGRRHYRIWLCVAVTETDDGRPVVFMAPPDGVRLGEGVA